MGVWVGGGVGVEVGVGVDVGVGVGADVDVDVGVDAGVGVAVRVNVGVAVGVAVAVDVAVDVAVVVAVAVGDAVEVGTTLVASGFRGSPNTSRAARLARIMVAKNAAGTKIGIENRLPGLGLSRGAPHIRHTLALWAT